jgi:uncharacterized membrane protein YheB (UPF0754 family)
MEDGKNNEEIINIIKDILYIIKNNNKFYDCNILNNDIKQFIKHSNNIFEELRNIGEKNVNKILSYINNLLTKNTKNEICKYLIDAVVNAIEKEYSNMINNIDISNIVEREINNMHPKQIEELFYSFAKNYFKKLTIYGWIGAFGGIINYFIEIIIIYFSK